MVSLSRKNSNPFLLWVMVIVTLGIVHSGQTTLTRNPYLSFTDDPAHNMTVSWGTQSLQTGAVWYGTSIPYSNTVNETTADTIHHVNLTELSISTHYFYKVISGDDSATGDFWTAPTPSESFEIIAYGDSRSNPAVHQSVVNRYMQYPHKLILSMGDLAYHGEYWEFDAYLFQPAAIALGTSPFISCEGSHDADPWNTPPDFTFTNYQNLMAFPGNELYFSFDYGLIHFTVLQSDIAHQYGPQTPQTEWLISDLTATHQPYRIVMTHMPPYTSGSGNLSNMLIRQYWCPIFQQHHVQMVINGHQHFYQRCEPGDSIVYVITGGGGAPLYTPTYDSSYVVSAYRANHFLKLQVNPDSIEVTAIDTSNTVLDQFSIFPWQPLIPEPIQNLTIQRDLGSIRLLWGVINQDTSGNPLTITQYRIYRNTLTPDFLPDSTNYLNATADTTFRDTSISPQTTHAFYQVTAVAP
jgi:hypothetical protein